MLKETPNRILLSVNVIPNARKTEIIKRDNDEVIKIRIAAPPEDGKANAELIDFLSKITNISKSRISIVRGKTSRKKVICFEQASISEILSCLRPKS